jgi:predicted nucleotidyltransferase
MPHEEYPCSLDKEAPVGSLRHGYALVQLADLEWDSHADIEAQVASETDVEELRELVHLYAQSRDSVSRAMRRILHHIENVHARADAAESMLARLRACRGER